MCVGTLKVSTAMEDMFPPTDDEDLAEFAKVVEDYAESVRSFADHKDRNSMLAKMMQSLQFMLVEPIESHMDARNDLEARLKKKKPKKRSKQEIADFIDELGMMAEALPPVMKGPFESLQKCQIEFLANTAATLAGEDASSYPALSSGGGGGGGGGGAAAAAKEEEPDEDDGAWEEEPEYDGPDIDGTKLDSGDELVVAGQFVQHDEAVWLFVTLKNRSRDAVRDVRVSLDASDDSVSAAGLSLEEDGEGLRCREVEAGAAQTKLSCEVRVDEPEKLMARAMAVRVTVSSSAGDSEHEAQFPLHALFDQWMGKLEWRDFNETWHDASVISAADPDDGLETLVLGMDGGEAEVMSIRMDAGQKLSDLRAELLKGEAAGEIRLPKKWVFVAKGAPVGMKAEGTRWTVRDALPSVLIRDKSPEKDGEFCASSDTIAAMQSASFPGGDDEDRPRVTTHEFTSECADTLINMDEIAAEMKECLFPQVALCNLGDDEFKLYCSAQLHQEHYLLEITMFAGSAECVLKAEAGADKYFEAIEGCVSSIVSGKARALFTAGGSGDGGDGGGGGGGGEADYGDFGGVSLEDAAGGGGGDYGDLGGVSLEDSVGGADGYGGALPSEPEERIGDGGGVSNDDLFIAREEEPDKDDEFDSYFNEFQAKPDATPRPEVELADIDAHGNVIEKRPSKKAAPKTAAAKAADFGDFGDAGFDDFPDDDAFGEEMGGSTQTVDDFDVPAPSSGGAAAVPKAADDFAVDTGDFGDFKGDGFGDDAFGDGGSFGDDTSKSVAAPAAAPPKENEPPAAAAGGGDDFGDFGGDANGDAFGGDVGGDWGGGDTDGLGGDESPACERAALPFDLMPYLPPGSADNAFLLSSFAFFVRRRLAAAAELLPQAAGAGAICFARAHGGARTPRDERPAGCPVEKRRLGRAPISIASDDEFGDFGDAGGTTDDLDDMLGLGAGGDLDDLDDMLGGI